MNKVLLVLAAIIAVQSVHATLTGTVYCNNGGATLKMGVVDKANGCAYGSFEDNLDTTGWGVLNVYTSNVNGQVSDSAQFFAAGVLEGAFTWNRIYDNAQNMFKVFFGNATTAPANVQNWLYDQDRFTRSGMVAKHQPGPETAYWNAITNVMNQFDGLKYGYFLAAPTDKSLDDFYFTLLNGVGDLLDLQAALDPSKRFNVSDANTEEQIQQLKDKIFAKSLCSALIRVAGDYSDIFMGHSSWFTFSSTNRIYKHYMFDGIVDLAFAAKRMSFSSYAGFLESLDDFYILSSGLVMIQTTNSILDNSLYDLLSPQTLLAWQRVRVANHLARNGQEWYEAVSYDNSGTYNNQYMIIDTKLFTPGQPLQSNLLWVVEQIPGLVVGADKTDVLTRGYWASYNVPAFEEIYNKSGYPAYAAKVGPEGTYELAPRAKIFRRDNSLVTDMPSFKRMMRYNNYLNDEYTHGNPTHTICARADLSLTNPRPDGCYDTKVTNFAMQAKAQCYAINGPTTTDNLPPFTWNNATFANLPHQGLPTTYNFDWIMTEPATF